MKKSIKALTMIITLTTTTLFASGGHSHDAHGGHSHHAPVSQDKAQEKAFSMVHSFVKKKVIDKSWSSAKLDTIEKKMIQGKEEWLIVFTNTIIKDKSKEKLYVFLTLSGRYIAANYTGK